MRIYPRIKKKVFESVMLNVNLKMLKTKIKQVMLKGHSQRVFMIVFSVFLNVLFSLLCNLINIYHYHPEIDIYSDLDHQYNIILS